MQDVILFLTSPIDKNRMENSLRNLKQLVKLNRDIIVLSTVPNINKEFHDIAQVVIYDFYDGTIPKKIYYDAFNRQIPYNGQYCTFYYSHPLNGTECFIFPNTKFLGVLRNTKTLITYARSQQYKNFLYVEDDHYFSDAGIKKLNDYFIDINTSELNAIYFTNEYSSGHVIQSYFWFGNLNYFCESVLSNFPERIDDIHSSFPYVCCYEYMLANLCLTYVHNKSNIKFENVCNTLFLSLFGTDSEFNQYYNFSNISDDSRLNIVNTKKDGWSILVLSTIGLNLESGDNILKIKIDGSNSHEHEINLNGCNMHYYFINTTDIINVNIYLNEVLVKEFKNIYYENLTFNGIYMSDVIT